jgi:hypothetical protein
MGNAPLPICPPDTYTQPGPQRCRRVGFSPPQTTRTLVGHALQINGGSIPHMAALQMLERSQASYSRATVGAWKIRALATTPDKPPLSFGERVEVRSGAPLPTCTQTPSRTLVRNSAVGWASAHRNPHETPVALPLRSMPVHCCTRAHPGCLSVRSHGTQAGPWASGRSASSHQHRTSPLSPLGRGLG